MSTLCDASHEVIASSLLAVEEFPLDGVVRTEARSPHSGTGDD
jgi:hypothetical protein